MVNRICIAAFAGAHGVQGDFKLKSFTAVPADVTAYGPLMSENGDKVFSLKLVREAKPGLFVARAPEVQTRDQAEAIKGTKLYVDRGCLPPPAEDEFYHEDLIGLDVQTIAGAPFGKVKAVLNYGAGDLLELSHIPDIKGSRMIAFTKEDVPEINFAARKITINVPDDFGDDPNEEGSNE